MGIFDLSLKRAVERRHVKEWHYDQDGNLHVVTSDDYSLTIPQESVVYFVSGLHVGEGVAV